MNEGDRIWDELDFTVSRWGLREIPFSESASPSRLSKQHEVFTGRKKELREVLNLFKGSERKRILIYGWPGIGKTAFIFEVLGILERKAKDIITAYISLPPEMDLATAALIALACKMDDDEWAHQLLNQMGIPTGKLVTHRTTEFKVGFGFGEARVEQEKRDITSPQFPTLSFEGLLKRALCKYSRVVIAVDDLDKQDPARARQVLHNAQGMLKGEAFFILTGHPSGITRDILTSERGLFDYTLELEVLDEPTRYRMLVNYLNSARQKNARYDPEDPRSVRPFTPETAQALCKHSNGVPRWLNRLGNYVLLKAIELQADIITPDVLQQGFEYTNRQLRGQSQLTPEDYYVLELVLEKGILSDATLTMADLERVRVKEFSEILPILDKLVQFDLVRRLPTERATEYEPTSLISGKHEKPQPEKNISGTGIIAGGDITIGDVSGQVAIGKNITQTQTLSALDKKELLDSLVEFQKEISKLGLPADDLSTINGDLNAAIKEAKKEEPDTSKVKSRFEGAIEAIKEVGDTIEKVSKWEWTGKILKILGKLGLSVIL